MPPGCRHALYLPACLLLAAAAAAEGAAPATPPSETELEEVAGEWQAAWEKSGSTSDSLSYGLTLQGLGIIERTAGKPAEAKAHLEEAVLRLAAAEPAARADVLEALALTRQDLGEVAAAGEMLRQVVALREALP